MELGCLDFVWTPLAHDVFFTATSWRGQGLYLSLYLHVLFPLPD